MSLDKIKMKHLMDSPVGIRAFAHATQEWEPATDKNASNQSGGSLLDEGKKHQTPEFVRHCVTAITEKPETLSRVKAQAPEDTDGSPFAICYAKYKQNTRSLAAKHATGKHHTIKQYEGALKTLRTKTEELRATRPSRTSIVFESHHETGETKRDRRKQVRFEPK